MHSTNEIDCRLLTAPSSLSRRSISHQRLPRDSSTTISATKNDSSLPVATQRGISRALAHAHEERTRRSMLRVQLASRCRRTICSVWRDLQSATCRRLISEDSSRGVDQPVSELSVAMILTKIVDSVLLVSVRSMVPEHTLATLSSGASRKYNRCKIQILRTLEPGTRKQSVRKISTLTKTSRSSASNGEYKLKSGLSLSKIPMLSCSFSWEGGRCKLSH